MIGGDDLKMILFQTGPKPFLMPFFPQWWSENVLRSFKSGFVHVIDREIQILRASFRVHRQAAVAGFAYLFQSVVAAQVDDVNRRARHLGQRDGSGGRLAFRSRGTRERMVLWRSLAFRKSLLPHYIHAPPLFPFHPNHPP